MYELELAREIISTKDTCLTNYIPIRSTDNEFFKYEDNYIEIIQAKNTKATHITIYDPLTTGGSNPIIYLDDDGVCYRCNGERTYFKMYAERLLGKEKVTCLYGEHGKETEKLIDSLFGK